VTWRQTAFPANHYVTSILTAGEAVVVAKRSHFYDKNSGGVWVSNDKDYGRWTRTLSQPVFNILANGDTLLAATAYVLVRCPPFSMQNTFARERGKR
jgi:hypothetical protein